MYFIVQQFLSLIKLLHSDNSDEKIAWAFVLGFCSAVMPLVSLQGILLVFLAIFLRFQIGAYLLSWLAFSAVTLPFLSLFHEFGDKVLSSPSLKPIFIHMQKNDLLALTRFNNTIVMGAFWACILLSPVLYVIFKFLLKKYRSVFLKYIRSTKVYYFLKSTVFMKVYDLYGKYGHA